MRPFRRRTAPSSWSRTRTVSGWSVSTRTSRPIPSRTTPPPHWIWRRAPRPPAGRASTRTSVRSTGRSARSIDSSSTYGFVTLRGGGLVRGRRDDHAHVHRRRVRQSDGARQRVRRHTGRRAYVHQLWRQSRQRVFRQSPSSRPLWFRRLPVSAVRVFGVQCPQQPRAGARAEQGRDVRLARDRCPSATAICG